MEQDEGEYVDVVIEKRTTAQAQSESKDNQKLDRKKIEELNRCDGGIILPPCFLCTNMQ